MPEWMAVVVFWEIAYNFIKEEPCRKKEKKDRQNSKILKHCSGENQPQQITKVCQSPEKILLSILLNQIIEEAIFSSNHLQHVCC